jgi:protein-S-isoprenylcysteine O-methyltransferase Ste14
MIIQMAVFAILSVGVVALSWRSLKNRRSHGFYRCFAFESILILLMINIDRWFSDPFSVAHIASWFLLFLSLTLAIDGFYLLNETGKPSGRSDGSANLGFENTTHLVISRSYRFIRHPLYCSLLLLAWGVFLKDVTFWTGIAVLTASGSLYATAKFEERENVARFGDEYVQYMGRTKMFIPYLL